MWGRSGWWCRRTGPCESARPCKLSPRKDVRSRLLMQERSILFGSLLGVDINLERFVGDLDLFVRVFCESPSLAQTATTDTQTKRAFSCASKAGQGNQKPPAA